MVVMGSFRDLATREPHGALDRLAELKCRGVVGDDILVGGRGSDKIDAGKENDLVIGGLGGDKIHGGQGEDVLVGGWTV